MNTPFPKRFALRFATVFAVLLYFPTPLDLIPKLDEPLADLMEKLWSGPLMLAANCYGQALGPPNFSGSGDGLRAWLQLACAAVLALLGGLLWALDAKRTNDEKLHDALRDYLRLALMVSMLVYGWSKVLLVQMPAMDDHRLFTPYAESSPMGLLWRFMAFSPAYERFSGAMEMLGGVLLLTRRTATLGALVVAGVMTQVVMLNFCFDVPVKLFSSQLLLTALFLLLPDARRLFDFLLMGREGRAQDRVPRYFVGPKLRWVRMAPFALAATMVTVTQFLPSEPREVEPSFTGEYAVLDQQAGSRQLWVSLLPFGVRVRPAEGDSLLWAGEVDEQGHYALKSVKDPKRVGEARVETLGPDRVHLLATLDGEAFDLTLLKRSAARLPLVSRGFHWVQESPINW